MPLQPRRDFSMPTVGRNRPVQEPIAVVRSGPIVLDLKQLKNVSGGDGEPPAPKKFW